MKLNRDCEAIDPTTLKHIKILYFDADVFLYLLASRHQEVYKFKTLGDIVVANKLQAIADLHIEIKKYQEMFSCEQFVLCLSQSSTNFRHSVVEGYKSNRSGGTKPILHPIIKQYMLDSFPKENLKIWNNLEADDILGICQSIHPDHTVILTIDKDLNQIPGYKYNLRDRKAFYVTNAQANKYFWYQVIVGDPVDGYYGIKGVGNKGAHKLLDKFTDEHFSTDCNPEVYAEVLKLYKSKNSTEKYLIDQCRLAKILQKTNFDKSTSEIVLWTPPTPRIKTLVE